MKKLILLVLLGQFVTTIISAQTPLAFNYQTVVRDNFGELIINQSVSFRIGILQDSINGALIYSETHALTTNEFGLALLKIGTGTVESGVFANISWATAYHFLKVEIDANGGTNYQFLGISQLLSVPYALHAKNVSNDKDEQTFSVSGDTLFISNGNYIILPGVSPYIPFSCGDILSDIDGNNYNTVLIGNQCWMKENLKTTTYQNGIPIPNVVDPGQWSNLTTGAYVWYDNDILWKDKYGALYNWYAPIDTNGLCPAGWHVPTNDEWTILTDFIGGAYYGGNKLKSCRQINSPLGGLCNTNEHPRWDQHWSQYGTDEFSFSGFPGGGRFGGTYVYGAIGARGYWWSSSETSSNWAWIRELLYNYSYVYYGDSDKKNGLSVRCLRD
ncbi:MAG: fibrobacter succinogenes major paralogous domain-containing protein [Bacteroidales bacterium]|nr:fibrobacter succinogenes major paralogous domain-containing protein [Bacteroidales bacterium]